ncbi:MULTISPECIES: dihydrolipoamide acetyltransferase family protein [Nocardia]|uniref:dihydrolipoamide acetyltransferase family protein n=1 Tax=Nocardia TaxID=1817 RepID=UPI000BF0E3E8|nr:MULTISPECIES: dihydrolipoamide acetyltransferase family protein [Nocardia]MBF6187880.1 2-oxo acid dehydrogenase subunit E2 [Nocardia farcinica]MBF6314290.1 2-oxo acid dehydrogenase subunit E2 [Nocardia farcinica]MBF6410260.1 2-oxo acid dehydrogenase subunit E2 [Nocardia farcinica]PEH79202.1 branched-chain alpha-keto acid dehydrogenase [Nocardia sp. FDAARGOS_372]UEX23837.1 2-oxo acid dehydrogenase subunit E2 [Nocardia farcinica]
MHDDGNVLEFRLPDLGEGLTDAELVSWSVAVGDHVDLNQTIAEVETAKAVVALPCPYAGTVAALLADPGETVPVGAPLIRVRADGAGSAVGSGGDAARGAENGSGAGSGGGAPGGRGAATADGADIGNGGGSTVPAEYAGAGADAGAGAGADVGGDADADAGGDVGGGGGGAGADSDAGAASGNGRRSVLVGYGPEAEQQTRRRRTTGPVPVARPAAVAARPAATPAARKLARELGVDLWQVDGSGPNGAVTVDDVRAAATPTGAAVAEPGQAREERTPVTGVRKRTAAAMVTSATTIPQASTFVTVDCTATMELIDHLRTTPAFAGLSLTPLVVVAKAVLAALAEFPGVNAQWDEERQQIVTKRYVHLGIAAATDRGLLVPSVKEAHRLSLRELCAEIGRTIEAARAGTATPADLTGGTFTITNVGVFGVDSGVPLVNPGEAAILCLGAIGRRPWVVADELAVRWVTTLGLSFDHRLIDGELAARFLATVAGLLTDPLTLLSRL